MDKLHRLLVALKIEVIKRLPYIAGAIVIAFLIGGILSYQQTAESVKKTNENTTAIRRLSEQNKLLSQQNKDLSQQNNRLNSQIASQVECTTNLFISFINNSGIPTSVDAKRCRLKAIQQSYRTPDPTTTSKNNNTTSNKGSTNSANPKDRKTNTNNGSGENKDTTNDHEVKRVLGVPACVPDPLSFITNGLCVTN